MANTKYYVIDDERVRRREGFVADEAMHDKCMASYSGYYTVKIFDCKSDAEQFCTEYNAYAGCQPVKCTCCSTGCTMTAEEYGRWNGLCAYAGE